MNTNEAPAGPPAAFVEAYSAAISEIRWHRYPDRQAIKLRTAIAAMHDVEPAQILVANGSNEILQTICLTFAGAGRSVMTFEPTYAMHGQIARTTQCEVIEVDRSAGFGLEPRVLRAALADRNPNVVFLCSPNNPTGTAETLENVELAVANASGVVVVDEAYAQFAPFSALEVLERCGGADADVALLVTRTFSKTWSMAGARLGYAVGPSWMISEMQKVLLPYHLDTAKQLAGTIALDFQDDMHNRVASIIEQRGKMAAALSDLGVEVWPSQSNFILFRTSPTGQTGDEVWRALVDRSVLVRNCSSWPRLADCLRVTIGSPDDNDRFIKALTEVLRNTRTKAASS